ncbi:peptidase M50 family protein [Lyngbya aestuarii BL J]|uniref:Peptidase M50 family protein n=1 Tax=Lyngbya aestuarii BL J TaxID=1348334 RepID=U7QJW5_9CYAN|nr:site-2 protease family protein [Lyngbya aestuarii]ERT08259.1 peptidase M50 family protein [Lyngbya aestuarii BL J]
MLLWLWLLLLGLITYWILRRGVARITRTPIWILWLVMMTPALIWSTWQLVYGEQKRIPPELIIIPFIVCPCVYWFLVKLGRQSPPPTDSSTTSTSAMTSEPTPKSPPPRVITPAEESQLRECFPWSVFPLQKLEHRPQAVICRGQIRSNPELVYQTIRDQIKARFGDRFIVVFQTDLNDQPFFALVPNPFLEKSKTITRNDFLNRPILALALLVITVFTTTMVGVKMTEISPEIWRSDPSWLLKGLPYALALMAILGIHKSVHYLAARYYQIRPTLPYFIPVPFFPGTFGAFMQIRSPLPHRRALFDVSIAGPWAGFIATLPILIWGLAHSTVVPIPPDGTGIFNVNAIDPRFSLLLTVLSKLILGTQLTATHAIDLHPVAIAGYLGLILTAFHFLPIGLCDGGHMIHAMMGQRTSMAIGQVSRILILVLGFTRQEFLYLAIILFLLPLNDEPALNDVSELNNIRDFIGLLTLALLLVILLPVPQTIAQWLNY